MLLRVGSYGIDVGQLQQRLFQAGYTKVAKTHIYDDKTTEAVKLLQKKSGLVIDGIYGPKTAQALLGRSVSKLLKQSDLVKAAQELDVPLAAVQAVNEVESNGKGFIDDNRPVILFERHIFFRRLQDKKINVTNLTKNYPGIVNSTPGGYAGNRLEYTRLAAAETIYPNGAYESCSWGLFQIMGFHWERLGYESVVDFVSFQKKSEADQLETFVRFIKSDKAIHKSLQSQDWAKFASLYNGPNYKINFYDTKLERAYERYSAQ